MTRTPTLPPNDKTMWRKLVARAHPDAGGDHELFIWTGAVRDIVCAERSSDRSDFSRRCETSADDIARVPYPAGADFAALTGRALQYEAGDYSRILALLKDCWPTEHLAHEEQRGASYKRLAYIAHLCGMSKAERVRWYRIAEDIPLSDRHAGHIISAVNRADAA
jgi:hypothetical protein